MRPARILQIVAVAVLVAGLIPDRPNLAVAMPCTTVAGAKGPAAKVCMPLPPPRCVRTPIDPAHPSSVAPIRPQKSPPKFRPMLRM